jgi:tRNA dimethylallyltransferase
MAELVKDKYLIVIAGPTAIGKTSLSIELANRLGCPILSFDSRQFYKELTIGTAKPSADELAMAEHHFIDSRSVEEVYTAGMFENDAILKLKDLFQNNDYCIAVGGSGLYIDALCYGIDDIPSSEDLRKELYSRLQNEGLSVLQEEVKKADPEYFRTADMKNPRRVMRALEVFQLTAKPYSSFRSSRKKERTFSTIWIGLEMDLESLYERINSRVESMIEDGLIKEVKGLVKHRSLKALKTVGYREILDYLDGKEELEKTVELIKRNTRRYARKQFTWFRKNNEIKWFDPKDKEAIFALIQAKTEN